jgi:hypothetical protein
VSIHVDDGRNFVRRSASKYDVIQASLVDTWAATRAGRLHADREFALHEGGVREYLDHLTDDGLLTITRWVFDGLRWSRWRRSVRRARARCVHAARDRRYDRVATFLLKKQPFTPRKCASCVTSARSLASSSVCARTAAAHRPRIRRDAAHGHERGGLSRLILADNREQFLRRIRSTNRHDRRSAVLLSHDAARAIRCRSLRPQHAVRQWPERVDDADGDLRALVVVFVIGPLLVGGERPAPDGRWLAYFGALGAGFMLLEVALLQRFVLLLGHPVYSLTVTLSRCCWERSRFAISRHCARRVRDLTVRALGRRSRGVAAAFGLARLVDIGIPGAAVRIAFAVALITPVGILLGCRCRGGMRCSRQSRRYHSVGLGHQRRVFGRGATLAVFIAMNWGFSVTLMSAARRISVAA